MKNSLAHEASVARERLPSTFNPESNQKDILSSFYIVMRKAGCVYFADIFATTWLSLDCYREFYRFACSVVKTTYFVRIAMLIELELRGG